ncbi:hypothetical protein AVEN_143477-1 [Araneus ventricosus]|uniref:Uncharacterized protein n=1 Tax=Araneus ventricosus TaxID=182803 RepID=A0A4Y2J2D1_ARAVE|nr:hypothetical protein AVEN_143477-1 [Araneus ventricosus]
MHSCTAFPNSSLGTLLKKDCPEAESYFPCRLPASQKCLTETQSVTNPCPSLNPIGCYYNNHPNPLRKDSPNVIGTSSCRGSQLLLIKQEAGQEISSAAGAEKRLGQDKLPHLVKQHLMKKYLDFCGAHLSCRCQGNVFCCNPASIRGLILIREEAWLRNVCLLELDSNKLGKIGLLDMGQCLLKRSGLSQNLIDYNA